MKMVWVQIDPDTQLAVRIFKNHKVAYTALIVDSAVHQAAHELLGVESKVGPTPETLKHMDRGLAVSQIRRQVWNRQEGLCARCPEIIRWNGSHMHEKIHKGDGGEVSLENCELLCAECHRNQHPEKQVMFTKRTKEEE